MWNDFTSDLGLLEDIPVKRERIEMERKSKEGAQSVTFFFLLLLLCLDSDQHATLISFVFLHGLDWRRLYVSQGLEDAKHLL